MMINVSAAYGLFATASTRRPTARSSSACCVSGVFTPASAVFKLPIWSWLTRTHERDAGRLAVGDIIVKLALPFIVAREVRIVLVVAAEVDVGQGTQVWIERGDLHDPRVKRILHKRGGLR